MYGTRHTLAPIFLPDPVNVRHPLSFGRVAWWLAVTGLDGGRLWYDLMGANHGTLTNGATWRSGPAHGEHGAIELDGTLAQYIDLPMNLTALFTSDASLVLWLKMRNANPSTQQTGSVQMNSGGVNHYPWTDGNIYMGIFRSDRPSFLPSGAVDRTQWHQLSVTTRGGGLWQVYQDGNLLYATGAEAPISFGAALHLGEMFGYCFDGWMNSASLWNRELSPDELAYERQSHYAGYPEELNRRLPRAVRILSTGISIGTGMAAGAGTATGAGSAAARSTGTAVGVGSAATQGSSLARGAGTAAGAGTASSIGSSRAQAAGTIAGSGTAAGTGLARAIGAGTAPGACAVAGVGTARAIGTGTAAGTSSVVAQALASGSATGIGTASGAGIALVLVGGTAAGVGAAAGIGSAAATGAGTSSGAGTATAVGRSLVLVIGTSAGTGGAIGAGSASALGAGIGAATGSATVAGAGAALVLVAGTAVGDGTAFAVGRSLALVAGTAAGAATAAGASVAATIPHRVLGSDLIGSRVVRRAG